MSTKDNAFTDFIDSSRAGMLAYELDEALKELTKSVEETNGTGTLTVQIKLVGSGEGIIKAFDDIKVKKPKRKAAGSVFFANTDGSLSRKNSRQPELPFERTEASDGKVTPLQRA